MSIYFHTSRRHCQGITSEDVARLVEIKLQKERKIQEENGRDEKMNGGDEKINIRGGKMISELPSYLKLKKMRQEFQMNTNPSSYPSPHYTPQSGNGSSI